MIANAFEIQCPLNTIKLHFFKIRLSILELYNIIYIITGLIYILIYYLAKWVRLPKTILVLSKLSNKIVKTFFNWYCYVLNSNRTDQNIKYPNNRVLLRCLFKIAFWSLTLVSNLSSFKKYSKPIDWFNWQNWSKNDILIWTVTK